MPSPGFPVWLFVLWPCECFSLSIVLLCHLPCSVPISFTSHRPVSLFSWAVNYNTLFTLSCTFGLLARKEWKGWRKDVCLFACRILLARCCCCFKERVIKLIGVTQLKTWLSTGALSSATCHCDELRMWDYSDL